MADHDDLPQPIGRPQGGAKSDAGRAAYWRMQHESAIGALADLIAEHSEQHEIIEAEVRERIAQELESVRQSHQNCPNPECAQAYRDAARIARGVSQ